jgi:predicted GNAT superfamily acetyltransferase
VDRLRRRTLQNQAACAAKSFLFSILDGKLCAVDSPALWPIRIRKLTALSDFQRCVELQREIWNESDLETEPYTTFVVANQTGGQVIGAFDGEVMVGFTMALVGVKGQTPYLHSHMTGIVASHRDRRIGRLLKLFQRDDALSRDIRLVEWTFDPLEVRNAHFNFNSLGAIARSYVPNFYGITSSPLHNRLATDRLLAEWQLDSRRTIAAIENIPAAQPGSVVTIRIPEELDLWRKSDPARVEEVQSSIRAEFQQWFAKGYAAISLQRTPQGAEYGLIPWSDF